MKWFLLFALASSVVYSADIPESHLHDKLKYYGPSYPEVWKTTGPKVALYGDRGAWEVGVEHLKKFFIDSEFAYEVVMADDIRTGKLRDGFAVLAMPGGRSWEYLADLREEGKSEVLQFTSAGGGYFGVCAGAFYAVSRREGGAATGPYGIGLLTGTAYDGTALNTPPFKEGMLDFISVPHALMVDLPGQFRSVLLGGPSFRYSASEASEKHIDVLARFTQIGEPAIIAFQFGSGRVVLSGPHVEVEENITGWGSDYYDPESEWPMLQRVFTHLGQGIRESHLSSFPQ